MFKMPLESLINAFGNRAIGGGLSQIKSTYCMLLGQVLKATATKRAR